MENEELESVDSINLAKKEDTSGAPDIHALNQKIQQESAFIDLLVMELNKVIIGQEHMINSLLIALLSDGHILLEGVPGLAKHLQSTHYQQR